MRLPPSAAIWPWMLALAVLAAGLGLGPLVAARPPSDRINAETADDPPLGVGVSLPRSDVHGVRLRNDGTTLLIVAGTCMGCSLRAVNPKKLENAPYDQTVIDYIATPGAILAEIPRPAKKVRVLADPEGKLVQQLRAYSAPRFYLVRGGKLIAIWKDLEKWPSFWTGEAKP